MNYVYIVQCRDGTFYTGWTKDMDKRVLEHNQGKGAKYTRGRSPVVLKYYEAFATREEALKREHFIKKLSRQQKEKLIQMGRN